MPNALENLVRVGQLAEHETDAAQVSRMLEATRPFIKTMRVGSGFDVADNEIVKRVEAGALVVTAHIPLAAEVIEKGGHAGNPRGELYTTDNNRSQTIFSAPPISNGHAR